MHGYLQVLCSPKVDGVVHHKFGLTSSLCYIDHAEDCHTLCLRPLITTVSDISLDTSCAAVERVGDGLAPTARVLAYLQESRSRGEVWARRTSLNVHLILTWRTYQRMLVIV